MRPRIAIAAALVLLPTASASADPLQFTITDLGPNNGVSRYTDLLGADDRADFVATSFDPTAHPATAGSLGGYYDTQFDYESGGTRGSRSAGAGSAQNDAGVVVGTATHVGSIPVAFSLDPNRSGGAWQTPSLMGHGVISDIGPEGSSATAINDQGAVVGYWAGPGGNGGNRAFLETSGTMTDLGTLGQGPSYPSALNNAGQVVGMSSWLTDPSNPARPPWHAFLYDQGTMKDLNDLIPTGSGIVLNNAVGIDAQGRIVAVGDDSTGTAHEYLLTPTSLGTPDPVPEPSTLAIFGLAIGGYGAHRLARRR
jgi:probable HAF family extracellular repeat protein